MSKSNTNCKVLKTGLAGSAQNLRNIIKYCFRVYFLPNKSATGRGKKSVAIILHCILFGVACTIYSGAQIVSAEPVTVSDLEQSRLYEKTVTESATQKTNKTDTNQKELSFQEEDGSDGSEVDLEPAKEGTPQYSPDTGEENPASVNVLEDSPHISDSLFHIDYNFKNGLHLKTADNTFTLNPSIFLQMRYEKDDFDDKDDTSALTLRRGRAILEGNAYKDYCTYFFQLDSQATGKENKLSKVALIDYYTDINLIPFTKIRIGQCRLPSNRQWITPITNQQMIDRSLASNEFNLRRQVGVMAHDEYFNKKLEYNAAIYTGYYNVFNSHYTDKNELLGVLRLSYNPFGSFGYSESDIEFSESPLFHISGSVSFDKKDDVTLNLRKLGNVTDDNVENTMFVQETGFKYRGFSVMEELYWRNGNFDKKNITDMGCLLQGGYFVLPKKVETTLRYSLIDYDNNRENKAASEAILGLNYFFSGHRTKAQFNVVRLHQDTVHNDTTDYKFIFQVQLTL